MVIRYEYSIQQLRSEIYDLRQENEHHEARIKELEAEIIKTRTALSKSISVSLFDYEVKCKTEDIRHLEAVVEELENVLNQVYLRMNWTEDNEDVLVICKQATERVRSNNDD